MQEFKLDSRHQTQQHFKPQLRLKDSYRPAAEFAKSTHFSQSPPDFLLSSFDQSNSKRDNEIRLSDEDPHFSPIKLTKFNMDMTGHNFTTQMKQKAEPAKIAEEFISVKHFSDEQHLEQSRNNPKIRTM